MGHVGWGWIREQSGRGAGCGEGLARALCLHERTVLVLQSRTLDRALDWAARPCGRHRRCRVCPCSEMLLPCRPTTLLRIVCAACVPHSFHCLFLSTQWRKVLHASLACMRRMPGRKLSPSDWRGMIRCCRAAFALCLGNVRSIHVCAGTCRGSLQRAGGAAAVCNANPGPHPYTWIQAAWSRGAAPQTRLKLMRIRSWAVPRSSRPNIYIRRPGGSSSSTHSMCTPVHNTQNAPLPCTAIKSRPTNPKQSATLHFFVCLFGFCLSA